MFLKRIQLTDVRSIHALDLHFSADTNVRKWTMVLGENGTGKSTILRAIALLFSGSDGLTELLIKPDSWIRAGAKECLLSAEFVTAAGQERSVQLRFRRGQTIREIFQDNFESMNEIDAALSHSMSNYLTVGYGASRRLANQTSPNFRETFTHPRAQNVATLFNADATLNPLDSWAMNLDYRQEKDGFDVVRQAFSDLLPGVALSRIDRQSQELLFQTPDGELPLGQLSDGYQNMAGWCGDLLYRITEAHANYKNPLASRGLLLIDEIDLHLHPIWQRKLKQFLDEKLPNFQILATTHSPLTAQQAGRDELYFLSRPNATAPAELSVYAGVPDQLMLNQLITSPAFGLDTTASAAVEDLRREYRTLETQPTLSRSEKRKQNTLRTQLENLPNPAAVTPRDQEQMALLEKIEQALK